MKELTKKVVILNNFSSPYVSPVSYTHLDVYKRQGATQHRAKVIDDTPSAGLKVLSFFIPLVGLILFVVQSKDTPISAKEYGKWALIGFCTGIAFSIIWYFVVLASVSSMFKAFI